MTATVDLLILGAGWTSTFLIPLCRSEGVSYSATSRAGGPDTVPFVFDPESEDATPYAQLPTARTVLITFPIKASGASERLVRLYTTTHKEGVFQFIQLGTTSIWDGTGNIVAGAEKKSSGWFDRHSPFNVNERAAAEEELLAISSDKTPTTVLNLSGLWGGERQTKNWVGRVAPTKEALRNKGSIHMIHGLDVSRAILAVHAQFAKTAGKRWLLTDQRVYDWWDLASAWGQGGEPGWVNELMEEAGVRALPRDIGELGRALDSREFWSTFEISPVKARLE